MSVLWIVVALVGGCLVGILGMCLLIVSHDFDEEALPMLKDA